MSQGDGDKEMRAGEATTSTPSDDAKELQQPDEPYTYMTQASPTDRKSRELGPVFRRALVDRWYMCPYFLTARRTLDPSTYGPQGTFRRAYKH